MTDLINPLVTTDKEHIEALAEFEALWDAPFDSPEGERFSALADAIEAYEKVRWPMERPDEV